MMGSNIRFINEALPSPNMAFFNHLSIHSPLGLFHDNADYFSPLQSCGDVLTKKKLDNHRNSCRSAEFSCLDCMKHFHGTDYRLHTTCISEAEKYQGKLYKPKKDDQNHQPSTPIISAKDPLPLQLQQQTINGTHDNAESCSALVCATVNQQPHQQILALAVVDAPPRAPSPPLAPVNVFDFMIQGDGVDDDEWDESDHHVSRPTFVHPLQSAKERLDARKNPGQFVTPDARRSQARTISQDSIGQKKSGKRKRGQPEDLDLSKSERSNDFEAHPSLHTGLTGGINKLMMMTHQQNALPPSPAESPNSPTSPTSPMKRSRRNEKKTSDYPDKANRNHKKLKHHNKTDESTLSKTVNTKPANSGSSSNATNNLKQSALSVSASTSTFTSTATAIKRRLVRKRSVSPVASLQRKTPVLKAIEWKAKKPHGSDDDSPVEVSHAPTTKPVASFLDCLAKGTDNEEGVSLWRALKRWKKEGGSHAGEKDLWKRIKVRVNDRGELIICI